LSDDKLLDHHADDFTHLLICIDLHEHRVLTTEQLYELHFSSIQRARSRLLHLYELGVLWRTRPHTQHGSLPWHYILNEVGSWIAAEYLGIDPREVGYRNDRKRTIINSPQLRHARAANSFFTRMIFATRSACGQFRVVEWRGAFSSGHRSGLRGSEERFCQRLAPPEGHRNH
jgi:hypothetical protein